MSKANQGLSDCVVQPKRKISTSDASKAEEKGDMILKHCLHYWDYSHHSDIPDHRLVVQFKWCLCLYHADNHKICYKKIKSLPV